MVSDDPQDTAEQFDEDLLGGDELADGNVVTSDEAVIEVPPDRPVGIPFADADVTDESVSDRADREEPEVWERPLRYDTDLEESAYVEGDAADERLDTVIDLSDNGGE
jgi:hypothetical protein